MSMSRIGVQGQLLLENQEAAARDGERKRIRRFKLMDDVCPEVRVGANRVVGR